MNEKDHSGLPEFLNDPEFKNAKYTGVEEGATVFMDNLRPIQAILIKRSHKLFRLIATVLHLSEAHKMPDDTNFSDDEIACLWIQKKDGEQYQLPWTPKGVLMHSDGGVYELDFETFLNREKEKEGDWHGGWVELGEKEQVSEQLEE